MKKISLLGDIVVDLISQENQFTFKPVAGGSIFNTASTLAKLEARVSFYSALGNDLWGKYLLNIMDELNINSEAVQTLDDYKTSIAFAMIDHNKNASYDFYKSPLGVTIEPDNLEKTNIFHFGSFFALKKSSRPTIRHFIKKARKHNLIISYDPNFRKNHSLDLFKKDIINNFKNAHIIKTSIEDMENIFGVTRISDAFKILFTFNPTLSIITLGKDGAVASLVKRPFIEVEAPKIEVVDTVGAGDNFSAGMLYYLGEKNISAPGQLPDLTDDQLSTMVDFANNVACESLKVKGAQVPESALYALLHSFFEEDTNSAP